MENAENTDDTFRKLRAVKELELYDDASLKNIIQFYEECDHTPEMIDVKQNYTENGKIHMDIEWTDDTSKLPDFAESGY